MACVACGHSHDLKTDPSPSYSQLAQLLQWLPYTYLSPTGQDGTYFAAAEYENETISIPPFHLLIYKLATWKRKLLLDKGQQKQFSLIGKKGFLHEFLKQVQSPVDLYLIFEKSSSKNQVRQTGFLAF